MWGAIKKLFGGGDSGDAGVSTSERDEARICATALLVEAALSDGIYANIEAEQIQSIIKATFDLDDAETSRILDEAEARAEQAVDQHGFTKVVKRLPLSEREQLVASLWQVVFADGEESPFEEALVRKVADLLHVDPRKSRVARRAAAGDDPS